jgi:iron complex outermembrane receptor protein
MRLLLCTVLLTQIGILQSVQAQDAEPAAVKTFAIAPQSLSSALLQFSETAHVEILFDAAMTGNLQAQGLSGDYSPDEALRLLLNDTGLTYRKTSAGNITLEKNSMAPIQPTTAAQGRASEFPPQDRDQASTKQKPVKVPEIVVKEAQERDSAHSYVAEETNTATKSDIPLIETPQSITVITRGRMVAQEVNTVAEALRYTAGVQGEPNGFEPRLTFLRFRGFDNTTNGLFKDGLQLRNPGFAVSYNLEPYGAEQLDVLRGPASFLYGQGSPGGLLNYVSKRPTQESIHELQFLAGNFDRYEGRFDFGGRLNDSNTFSYRLTGLFRESGTQIDNVFNDRVYIAPALTWRMAPGTSMTFFATYQKDRLGMSQGLPVEGTLRVNPNGRISPHRFTGLPGVDKYDRKEYSVGYEFQHHLAEGWNFLQKLRYNSTELDDVSTFGFAFDADQRTLNRARQDTFGKLTAVAVDNQLNGKFSTGPLHHTLLTGVDFQRIHARSKQNIALASSIDIFNRYDYGASNTVPFSEFNQDTTQLQTGVYMQDQIKAFDHWLLTLGGRHDWARNETTDNVTGVKSSQDDRKATGRAALTYLFDIGLAPYISYSTFFLPSIGLDSNGNPFKPETGRQYEVGIKYQIPNTRTFLTAALFDLTRENYVQTDPGTFRPVQRGKARSRGLELEGIANFDSGVDLIASFTLLDNEIQETADPTEQGKRFTQVPAQFGSLWVKYTIPTGSMKGFGIGGGARYTGYNYADTANTFRVPSFVVGDAVIDYTWNHYRFALNVTNLLNQDAFGCFDRAGTNFCAFGERRTVVGTVAYRW